MAGGEGLEWRRQSSRNQDDEWFLLNEYGSFALTPHNVIMIGRELCDINVRSPSVDKRHAILCYDQGSDSFSVRDLKSTNGTFLNNHRLSSNRAERLKDMDVLQFGYAFGPIHPNLYQVRRNVGDPTSTKIESQQGQHKTSRDTDQFTTSRGGGLSSDSATTSGLLHVMKSGSGGGARGNSVFGNRVSSPSLTLDSGRGSSSVPSSPAKEMSPAPGLFSTYTPSSTSSQGQNNKTSLPSPTSNRKERLGNNNNNVFTEEPLFSHSPSLRRDSLEEAEDSGVGSTYKSSSAEKVRLNLNTSGGSDSYDLNVPNEVFDAQQDGNQPPSQTNSLPSIPFHSKDCLPMELSSEGNLSSMDEDCSQPERKKISPLAFTIDFGGNDSSKTGFGITDSISKFAPRNKRNLMVKEEEGNGTTSKEGKSSLTNSASLPLSSKKVVPRSLGLFNNSLTKEDAFGQPNKSLLSSSRIPGVSRIDANNKFRNMKGPTSSQTTVNSTKVKQRSVLLQQSPSAEEEEQFPTMSKPEKDVDDACSETGTYTVDKDDPEPAVEEARKEVSKSLDVGNKKEENKKKENCDHFESTPPGAPEWVREWAEQAAMQHKRNITPYSETQLYLRDTENVVSAMQERMNRNLSASNSHNSDSDDEATLSHNSPLKQANRFKKTNVRNLSSQSPRSLTRGNTGGGGGSDYAYQVGYQSDSSNDGMRDYNKIGPVKMNKAFNIRRGRIGAAYDSDSCMTPSSNCSGVLNSAKNPNPRVCSGLPPQVPASAFSRNDGGRFSLRMTKSKTPPIRTEMLPPVASSVPRGVSVPRNVRSASGSVASMEVTKLIPSGPRRQSTPLATGSKNLTNPSTRKPGNRSNSTLTAKEVELANWKRRKNYDPMRAAAEGRKKRECLSAAETTQDDIPPTMLAKQSCALLSKSMSFHEDSNLLANPTDEEDVVYVVDEMDSSHSNSPIHIPMNMMRPAYGHASDVGHYGHGHSSSSAIRPKNKLEALDNLVIATIHSMSNKIRSASRNLLEKLQVQYTDNENGALLEEMVAQMKELEMSSSNSSPNKSPSRELSGTLKNLKKLEQVILVLDRVLCDDSGSDANN